MPSPLRNSPVGASELSFAKTAEVSAALARLGRTEDLQFSPDGKRLAIAGFNKSRLLVIDLRFEDKAKRMIADNYLEVTSPS